MAFKYNARQRQGMTLGRQQPRGSQLPWPHRLRQRQHMVGTVALLLIILVLVLLEWRANVFSAWTLQHHDPVATLVQERLSEIDRTKELLVFGPAAVAALSSSSATTSRRIVSSKNDAITITTTLYTREQQRDFLEQFGSYCAVEARESNGGGAQTTSTTVPTASRWNSKSSGASPANNALVQRFDALPAVYGVELWKYCVLYTGLGHVYWEPDNVTPLVTWSELLTTTGGGTTAGSLLPSPTDIHANRALVVESTELTQHGLPVALLPLPMMHHSFLQVATPKSQVCANMLRVLLEETVVVADNNNSSNSSTTAGAINPLMLSQKLGITVTNDEANRWLLLRTTCVWAGDPSEFGSTGLPTTTTGGGSWPLEQQAISSRPCPLVKGYCCQAFQEQPLQQESMVVLAIRHPFIVATLPLLSQQSPLPFKIAAAPATGQQQSLVLPTEDELGLPPVELPYIATVREVRLVAPNSKPATIFETPNFFDILMENDCLPETKECFKCLKRGTHGDEHGGDCSVCRDECLCYCSALCSIRPPPKRVVAELQIQRPVYRKDPSRLIPRIIHQTWFEPVDKDKYPNMSRLIESWKRSGWEYHFYDDAASAQFLSAHFPPQIREAYDAITPGAFKADLFRYCVLLIRGGVYADMDIMLESNLDHALSASVGFVTAQDEPGEKIGHRSCLWNGFLASAPGHPFLARTIENVVNNIRNRFTSVDYDDMLCPNPVLSVSHTVDTLFTCGPCILGASINDVLGHHRQRGFDYGEVDLFANEKQSLEDGLDTKSTIEPNDMRLQVPGRTVLLQQNKDDMGAHRFTLVENNLVVASTDLPDYDDRPPTYQHYSKTHESFGIYGLRKQEASLYVNDKRANEEIRIRVV